jgi:hypothetical protein
MTIERSHEKARPTLPRASDLALAEGTVAERHRNHDEGGRFAARNQAAANRAWRRSLKKLIARDEPISDDIVRTVLEDAWRIFTATLRELPNDGPTVRGLALRKARHEALEGFWTAKAAALGLTSPEALACEDRATKHGQRAERVAVTMLDVASALAKTSGAKSPLRPGETYDDPKEDA